MEIPVKSRKNETENVLEKPLEVLKKLLPKSSTKQEPLFPFIGGAVGYVSYDSIRQYENIGEIPNDELETPDVHFLFFEVLVVFDHLEQKVYLVGISSKKWINSGRTSSSINENKTEITNAAPDGSKRSETFFFPSSNAKTRIY